MTQYQIAGADYCEIIFVSRKQHGARSTLPRIHINLSFDHELSLGGVRGSYRQNLFDPTQEILDLANMLDVKVTLFTDVMCSLRFQVLGADGFVIPYEKQLQHACQSGHDVQLHLHPHWMDTEILQGKFFPSHRYCLHQFRDEQPPNDIVGVVTQGASYLNRVCRHVQSNYNCIAFRAGGLNMSPSTDEIIDALWKNGIRIDSTVAPGYTFDSTSNSVDFSATPKKANWYVTPESQKNGVPKRDGRRGLFEVPIATVPRNPVNNIPALFQRMRYASRAPRTGGVPIYDLDATAIDKLKRLFPFSSWMLSFDYWWSNGHYLASLLKKYMSRFANDNIEDIYIGSLSHPKSMGSGGLTVMREFIIEMRKEYGDDLDFVTFPQIATQIRHEKVHESAKIRQ